MAVKIKLKRMGKIRSPHYRIIVADARAKRDGRAIEEIGKYHPKKNPSLIEVESERAQYWLGVGAQPTEPVVALLKVTGDWQKFKGLPGAEGSLLTVAAKTDKSERYNALLAEVHKDDDKSEAGAKKRAAKKPAAKKSAKSAEKAEKSEKAETKADDKAKAGADDKAAADDEKSAKKAAAKKAPAKKAAAKKAPAKKAAAEQEAAAQETAADEAAAQETAADEAAAQETAADEAAAQETAADKPAAAEADSSGEKSEASAEES